MAFEDKNSGWRAYDTPVYLKRGYGSDEDQVKVVIERARTLAKNSKDLFQDVPWVDVKPSKGTASSTGNRIGYDANAKKSPAVYDLVNTQWVWNDNRKDILYKFGKSQDGTLYLSYIGRKGKPLREADSRFEGNVTQNGAFVTIEHLPKGSGMFRGTLNGRVIRGSSKYSDGSGSSDELIRVD